MGNEMEVDRGVKVGKPSHENRIFLRNGPVSGNECYQLHQDLEEALTLMGGLQQGTEDDGHSFDVDQIAKKIFTKLTGREIKGI